MARLQIATLPTLTVGAVSLPEYLIVLDEADELLAAELQGSSVQVAAATGARGVLVFESRVEVVQ